ncbi:MAG: NAD-dependent epimerase/dehydratase family protein [Proteobacteria bacterium]|nr:NAD-dependent epimerase/dehydratase family protein [Pseudomonadota bacterium]NBP13311.1 NAD-dependent epimerase/dehydratase family protein [bacterium]
MKSILLLGRGYVGKTLDEFYRANNVLVDSFSRSTLDYTDPVVLQKFLTENKDKYDLVVNCAGYTGTPNVDGCEANKKECWFWNVIVPRNVVLSANAFELPVVQINSGCIYSGHEKQYTEEDEPNFGLYSDNSSFYSKCKHACETIFQNCYAYSIRIRMPFDGTTSRKNYLKKLVSYDSLISLENSLTSITDLQEFLLKFKFFYTSIRPGPINVVNEGSITAKEIVEMLKKAGINNPAWNFIDLDALSTVAKRSNCVLSTEKIREFNLQLPPVRESLERDISKLATQL